MTIPKKYNTPVTITFTGGLGAQIVSACAYYYLQSISHPVQADLSYFDRPAFTAKEGEIGKVSVWPWSLDRYGFSRESFSQNIYIDSHVIHDGPEKASLWIAGLQLESVHAFFKIPDSHNHSLRELINFDKFICIHLRRGDYLNVATHIQDDSSFIRILKKFSKIINDLLVVSDSPLTPEFTQKILELGFNTKTYINGDEFQTHNLMRISDVLICSNSQFSYTAGFLRDENLLTVFPSKHVGDSSEPSGNHLLNQIREFQIVTKLM